MLQFGIGRLLSVITAIAVFCGLAFAAPPLLGAPLLYCALIASPAIWVSGVVYARGREQAFFLGGLIGGAAPWCIMFYWYSALMIDVASNFPRVRTNLGDLLSPAIQSAWSYANAAILAPGIASFAGGAMSMLVHRAYGKKKIPPTTSSE